MSLPVSLTTDCGGLLNRRGPGRKCCCHTDALHAGYHVYSSHGLSRRSRSFHTSFLLVPNYRICELVYFHTENRGRSRGFVTNYRIVEFFFTRRVTESLGIYVTNYRIIEFLFTRRVAEVFFVTRHVLGHEFASCRISFFTRMVAEVMRGEL